MSNILNGHTKPTFLHVCAKTQPNVKHTSQVTAKYVLETYMPTQLGMCAIHVKYVIDLYGRFIHIYVPHEITAINTDNWHCTHI